MNSSNNNKPESTAYGRSLGHLVRRLATVAVLATAAASCFSAVAEAGVNTWTQFGISGAASQEQVAVGFNAAWSSDVYEAVTVTGKIHFGTSTEPFSQWVTLPHATTSLAPSIAVTSAGPFIAWTQSGTGDVMVSSWLGTSVQVGGGAAQSSQGPAICSFGTHLDVAYKGLNHNYLYVSQDLGNGLSGVFQTEVRVPDSALTTFTPALTCTASGSGVIAWTSPLSTSGISSAPVNVLQFASGSLRVSSFGFIPDSTTTIVPGASSVAGPATALNGGVTLLWTTTSDTIKSVNNFDSACPQPGRLGNCGWYSPTTLPMARTKNGPAVVVFTAKVPNSCSPTNNDEVVAYPGRSTNVFNLDYETEYSCPK